MKLKPLPNTVVHVPTREEWNELCLMLHNSGMGAPRYLTSFIYHAFDCISVNEYPRGAGHRERYEREGWKIIDLQTYKKEQGLMKKELKDMKVDDILVNEHKEYEVVEVFTNSFAYVDLDNPDYTSASIMIFAQASALDLRFKDQPAPKKLTHEQIEEALGYPVEIVEEQK